MELVNSVETMPSLKSNLVANFVGAAWSSLMSLLFVPFYIRLMGAESFGVIGVFTALTAMLGLLDLGLSQAMNREMARLSVDGESRQLMADTTRTLEIVYWTIASMIVTIVLSLSHLIVYHWLNPVHLSRETILQSLWVMAFVIGLRWPIAIYAGGLNGLQKQVAVNVVQAVFATLYGFGAFLILRFVSPTLTAFFSWQAVVALAQVATSRFVLWRNFSTTRPAFRGDVVRNVWRFAAGVTGISIVSLILTQIDDIVLSRTLSLVDFGYFAFAITVSGVTFRLVGPAYGAYYPRLTQLVAKGMSQMWQKRITRGARLWHLRLCRWP